MAENGNINIKIDGNGNITLVNSQGNTIFVLNQTDFSPETYQRLRELLEAVVKGATEEIKRSKAEIIAELNALLDKQYDKLSELLESLKKEGANQKEKEKVAKQKQGIPLLLAVIFGLTKGEDSTKANIDDFSFEEQVGWEEWEEQLQEEELGHEHNDHEELGEHSHHGHEDGHLHDNDHLLEHDHQDDHEEDLHEETDLLADDYDNDDHHHS
jgi:hypothetical protein